MPCSTHGLLTRYQVNTRTSAMPSWCRAETMKVWCLARPRLCLLTVLNAIDQADQLPGRFQQFLFRPHHHLVEYQVHLRFALCSATLTISTKVLCCLSLRWCSAASTHKIITSALRAVSILMDRVGLHLCGLRSCPNTYPACRKRPAECRDDYKLLESPLVGALAIRGCQLCLDQAIA